MQKLLLAILALIGLTCTALPDSALALAGTNGVQLANSGGTDAAGLSLDGVVLPDAG